jgi:hypothetical protein
MGVDISPIYPCCRSEDETIILVLRDSTYATQIWIRLVPSNYITDFFPLIARTGFLQASTRVGIEIPTLSER